MIVIPEQDILIIQKKFQPLSLVLNERSKRIWAATEAISYGKGGVMAVHKATSISRNTIYSGIKEIDTTDQLNTSKLRQSGAGRKTIISKNPDIIKDLEEILESSSRGDPESPLRWTCKSVRNIEGILKTKNYKISFRSICDLLKRLGYSLQSNRKTLEGKNHPDRNAQFEYINDKSTKFLKEEHPVISIDTKKKENIGKYKNSGSEYAKQGKPIEVNTYDFPDKKLGKISPYGVYDIGKNKGWVSVGISSDTAKFAVNSIRTWWQYMGKETYSDSPVIYINADGGGSNGHRVKLWKVELQKLANEINKIIHVSHFPPGTSKWNKIEHRMFSYISQNWRGKPLETVETVINLISNTTTKKGLEIKAMLDENIYETGIEVSDKELSKVNIMRDEFHGEWNYKIIPQGT